MKDELHSKLAELLLPDVRLSPPEIAKRYPKRELPQGAMVTRFAPSPTGFVHMGGLFAALISERLARQSGGLFYLRIEDTDRKREVKGSIPQILKSLDYFGIGFDEGETESGKDKGLYGPYRQSLRRELYRTYAKELILKGLAYPCFCTGEDLDALRAVQKAEKQLTGYYGNWASCRDQPPDEVNKALLIGKPFVLRLKSPGNPEKKISFQDLVKGGITMPENGQDIVLLKSDGLPTYHFAHVVDDYLMGTTHVLRGDEWLSSVPVHIQLYEVLGWKPPLYGHLSPIMKMDGTSKRKFSKRKDPEFAASWYQQQGYWGYGVREYLLGLANSDFEDWRSQYPDSSQDLFRLKLEKMSSSGPLFDLDKFNNINRNVLASLDAQEVYAALKRWAADNDPAFYEVIDGYKDYTLAILSIGRGTDKPRKEFAKWAEIKPAMSFFYDELFENTLSPDRLPQSVNEGIWKEILKLYLDTLKGQEDNGAWFERLKAISQSVGLAPDMKTYRKNPEVYKGHVGDVAMVIRVALTGRTQTPDLFDIIRVMGEKRVRDRLARFL